jgi:hypothetical protein
MVGCTSLNSVRVCSMFVFLSSYVMRTSSAYQRYPVILCYKHSWNIFLHSMCCSYVSASTNDAGTCRAKPFFLFVLMLIELEIVFLYS